MSLYYKVCVKVWVVSKYIHTFLVSLRTLMNHSLNYINITIKPGNFWSEFTVASDHNIDLFFTLKTVRKIQQMQFCFTLNYSLLQCMPSTNSRNLTEDTEIFRLYQPRNKLKCHGNHLLLIPICSSRENEPVKYLKIYESFYMNL